MPSRAPVPPDQLSALPITAYPASRTMACVERKNRFVGRVKSMHSARTTFLVNQAHAEDCELACPMLRALQTVEDRPEIAPTMVSATSPVSTILATGSSSSAEYA